MTTDDFAKIFRENEQLVRNLLGPGLTTELDEFKAIDERWGGHLREGGITLEGACKYILQMSDSEIAQFKKDSPTSFVT